jgi:predicted nucleic acid-binding protein
VIVVDTTVLVYFLGGEHPLREPCRRFMAAVRAGQVQATTTVEVIQDLVHVRSRRRPRAEVVRQARNFARFLTPLLRPTAEDLSHGLSLFQAHTELGAFDAVLAATAIGRGAEALVSADRAFAAVGGLRHVDPASPEMAALLDG